MEKIYNNLNIENLMKTEMFNQLNKGLFSSLKKCRRMQKKKLTNGNKYDRIIENKKRRTVINE